MVDLLGFFLSRLGSEEGTYRRCYLRQVFLGRVSVVTSLCVVQAIGQRVMGPMPIRS
jgi:hypothetical protein